MARVSLASSPPLLRSRGPQDRQTGLLTTCGGYLWSIGGHGRTGRLYFGRNKVMAKALGTTPEDELLPGLYKVSAVRLAPSSFLFAPLLTQGGGAFLEQRDTKR